MQKDPFQCLMLALFFVHLLIWRLFAILTTIFLYFIPLPLAHEQEHGKKLKINMLILIISTQHLSINLVSRHFFVIIFFFKAMNWLNQMRRHETEVIRLNCADSLILCYGSIGNWTCTSIFHHIPIKLRFAIWKLRAKKNIMMKQRYLIWVFI